MKIHLVTTRVSDARRAAARKQADKQHNKHHITNIKRTHTNTTYMVLQA